MFRLLLGVDWFTGDQYFNADPWPETRTFEKHFTWPLIIWFMEGNYKIVFSVFEIL